MSKLFSSVCGIVLATSILAVEARESISEFDVANGLKSPGQENLLDIGLFFGDKKHPKIDNTISKNVTTSKKTNAFGKSDEVACNRAFLSAIISLQKRASTSGGNAVINIRSNFKHNEYSSQSKFQCGAGNVIAGVALKGDIVKLAK